MHVGEVGAEGAIQLWSRTRRGGRQPLPAEDDSEAAALVALVARHKRVPIHLLLHHSRCQADVVLARHLSMYLMHVVLSRTFAQVGRFFGRDRTTVGYACARIEDMRDRVRFDSFVMRLEHTILLAQEMAEDEEQRDAA